MTTSAEKMLILFSVLTMLVIGGAFLGAVFFFNSRLNQEQKETEAEERDDTGHAGGSGSKPEAPPPGRDFQPMAETPQSYDNG